MEVCNTSLYCDEVWVSLSIGYTCGVLASHLVQIICNPSKRSIETIVTMVIMSSDPDQIAGLLGRWHGILFSYLLSLVRISHSSNALHRNIMREIVPSTGNLVSHPIVTHSTATDIPQFAALKYAGADFYHYHPHNLNQGRQVI